MENVHRVAETLRAQRVTVPIDGAMPGGCHARCGVSVVDVKLDPRGPHARTHSLDVEGLGAARLRPDELRITNLFEIDAPALLAANRERAGFLEASALASPRRGRASTHFLMAYHLSLCNTMCNVITHTNVCNTLCNKNCNVVVRARLTAARAVEHAPGQGLAATSTPRRGVPTPPPTAA